MPLEGCVSKENKEMSTQRQYTVFRGQCLGQFSKIFQNFHIFPDFPDVHIHADIKGLIPQFCVLQILKNPILVSHWETVFSFVIQISQALCSLSSNRSLIQPQKHHSCYTGCWVCLYFCISGFQPTSYLLALLVYLQTQDYLVNKWTCCRPQFTPRVAWECNRTCIYPCVLKAINSLSQRRLDNSCDNTIQHQLIPDNSAQWITDYNKFLIQGFK